MVTFKKFSFLPKQTKYPDFYSKRVIYYSLQLCSNWNPTVWKHWYLRLMWKYISFLGFLGFIRTSISIRYILYLYVFQPQWTYCWWNVCIVFYSGKSKGGRVKYVFYKQWNSVYSYFLYNTVVVLIRWKFESMYL